MSAWRPFSFVRDLGSGARAEAGNVAIAVALAAPLLLGGAGLAVETTYWRVKALHLQDAADAAAHAGALEQRSGADVAKVAAVATATAKENGFDPGTETIQVNTPPASGPWAGKPAVEVILHAPVQRYLTAMLMPKDLVLGARAVAAFNAATNACILALNPSQSKAALFSGNTTATLSGCSVMANSTAPDAAVVQGSAALTTDCLIVVGGYQATSNLTVTKCPSPVTNAPAVGDPFKGVPVPAKQGGCLKSGAAVLSPGWYCQGMSLKNNVTLSSGVYFLSGDFSVNAGASVTGSGVTIYLAPGSHIGINGNSTIKLSAPTAGTYAGMLFMGDRSALPGKDVINGDNTSKLTGAIYMPRDEVDYLGNFSGQNGCTQLVADTIQWSGSTTIAGDCTGLGMQPIPVLAMVKLTE